MFRKDLSKLLGDLGMDRRPFPDFTRLKMRIALKFVVER